MKKIYVLLATALIAGSSCKKETTAAFSTERTTVYLTESVSFNNTSKNGSSYSWDFGDGSTSTDANPTHAYTKAGTYNVTLTADGSVISHPIKVGNGTASYVIKNNTSLTFEAVSFYVDANNELLDPTEHGMLAASATSDTIYTSRNAIQLGGIVDNRIFIVVNGYPITKFKHNDLVISNNTQVYFGDDASGNSNAAPAITRAKASYRNIVAQKANNKPMIYIQTAK